MSGKNSVQVAIKVRPLSKKEKDQQFSWRIVNNSIQLLDVQTEPYYFDHIFDQNTSNLIIFDKMAKQIVHSAIQGINGTIFAYGQTSSGKTYTMMGDDDNPGVMVLAAKEIFKEIEKAEDRQFLLRVGYIEIYNEKIYDLLNKKNQDLKIHDTATGIVNVNCEEIIIRSEDDLLNYLDKGGKERTVGETFMNERSSRSHAIFRIIIESRKMNRSEDDAVIQSVINLVDLAGSERADQTGARGTRLKEGGHINKSLLFLSNVIKRLSENVDDKYISFRDSKLTRILQASLGGNALTAIICTIKPNAVEETQSTLNFALRAKAIKNRPKVNEIVSEATMMKRLEHEIKVLKTRLEEEQRKNESQLKVRQLEQRIKDEDLKIISCNSFHYKRNQKDRRRTWCPSTNLDTSTATQQTPLLASGSSQPSRLPALKAYNTPLITMRPLTEPVCTSKPADGLPEIQEEFIPGELVNFDKLTPLQTPHNQKLPRNQSITPKLISCPKSTLEKVEHDLLELQSFTNLENKIEVKHEPDLALKQKVETLSQRNAILENERLEYLQIKSELQITSENLTETKKRGVELQAKFSEVTNANKAANAKIEKYEAELAELKNTKDRLEMENREVVNLEFEIKSHKHKSTLRENELLEALQDKEKEIVKLEKSLSLFSSQRFQNSKEELLQKSLYANETQDGNAEFCVRCGDLQRLLEGNKKSILEFETLTLEYENLRLNYAKIEKEHERNKQLIIDLEDTREKEKSQCEKLILEVQQLKSKLQNVQKDYELLNNENYSKHEEGLELNKQLELARNEMMVLENKCAQLELSWEEQNQTIIDIENKYATIQSNFEQLQCEYENLKTTSGQSVTDYQRLEKENCDLQTDIEDLKKKLHDVQERLLESNAKYEETAKKTKDSKEEHSKKSTQVQQQNEQLKKQVFETQTQLESLQKEYDDLSNQLMDNLQDCEILKKENLKLIENIKCYEEKDKQIIQAAAEIDELKLLFLAKRYLIKSQSSCHNSVMRGSDLGVENEEGIADYPHSQDLLSLFSKLCESLTEIELQYPHGKTKVFLSASKNSTSNNYKMLLKNIFGIQKIETKFDMKIENVCLQGSFMPHSFHIVELTDNGQCTEIQTKDIDIDGCENNATYIEELKQEILQLKAIREQEQLSSKMLLESTERAVCEMREQISQLSNELMEKSQFVENCACKCYQQQIESLEKEKADITIMCEELQERVNSTFRDSVDAPPNDSLQRVDDKIKEIEQLKLRQQELLESYDLQTKTLEEITQRCIDVETHLESAREQLKVQEQEFKENLQAVQLEYLEKIELSANEYRDNIRKYNNEWEARREDYEKTIKELQHEINCVKQNVLKSEDLEDETQDHVNDNQKAETKNMKLVNTATSSELQGHQETEIMEVMKLDKCRLEQEKLCVQQQLTTAEEALSVMREENRTQCEQLSVLNDKLLSLEETLADAKSLHVSLGKENVILKTEINNIKEQHEKNQEQSDEMEHLHQEYSQLQNKLKEAEVQLKEHRQKEASREDLIGSLQAKLTHLLELEKREISQARDFENLKQEYTQIQDKLQKAEAQIQEFCYEDARREELVQTLQTKLRNMTTVEEENRNLEIESVTLKETLSSLQEKDRANSKEIEHLKQNVVTLMDNVAALVSSETKLKLDNNSLGEKVGEITNTYDLLKTDKVSLDRQLLKLTEKNSENVREIENLEQEVRTLTKKISEMSDSEEKLRLENTDLKQQLQQILSEYKLLQTDKVERKSLNLDCSALLEEEHNPIEKLQYQKEKGQTEDSLENVVKEKATIAQNLRLTIDKLEVAQKQVMAQAEIQENLKSLNKSLLKTIEEKQQQLDETERKKEDIKPDHLRHCQDLLEQDQKKLNDYKQDNSQLRTQLHKVEHEKQEDQFSLEKKSNKAMENLFISLKKKEQELRNLENNYQNTQQQNQELKQKLKDLAAELLNIQGKQQEKSKLNTQLQAELLATKKSVNKQEEEVQNLQQILIHCQNLREDKNKLEATLTLLKMGQGGDLSILQEEKDELCRSLQQYGQQREEFKQKEETLKQKIDSLLKQNHEINAKMQSYEQLSLEHKKLESMLTKTTATNQTLQQQVSQLTSQKGEYDSRIVNLSAEIEKLNSQLAEHKEEKDVLQTKLNRLEILLQGAELSLEKERHEQKSAFEELKLKYESLFATNTKLETINQQMTQQLNSAKEKLTEFESVQEELKILKVQHSDLQFSLKKSVDEAGRCISILREDVEHHKQLSEIQLERYNSIKTEMETKHISLSEENSKLITNMEMLQKEKLTVEEKLREIIVRNFELDLQRNATDITENASFDSNTSQSSKGRRSLDRVNDKTANISWEEKIMQQKNTTTAERKNHRLSTHDERRRQSFWEASHDKETMTDAINTCSNCKELDRKLKEYERDLFIKLSQVTALQMELKNHPLIDDNAMLKKRLQEEQDKHRNEIKRYKSKLHEQNAKAEKALAEAAHATAKSEHALANAALAKEQQVALVLPKVVVDVESQTDNDVTACVQKLQGKYNDLKNICRYRYNIIKELEEKVAQKENSAGNSLPAVETAPLKSLNNQCMTLKKELDIVKQKYECAKKVLSTRREEIVALRAQLEPEH